MSDINNRIFKIIEHFGLNKNSFSKKIGLENNVTVGNIVGGRLNKPSYDIIEKILLTFDSINCDWLVTGNGSMLKKDNTELNSDLKIDQIECKLCEEKERIIKSKDEVIKSKDEIIKSKDETIESLRKNNILLENLKEINQKLILIQSNQPAYLRRERK